MPEEPVNKPEASPFDRMRSLVKQVVSVPKSEVDEREKEWRENRSTKPLTR